jgi:hypothetical protein
MNVSANFEARLAMEQSAVFIFMELANQVFTDAGNIWNGGTLRPVGEVWRPELQSEKGEPGGKVVWYYVFGGSSACLRSWF